MSRDASSGRILVVKTGSTVPSVRRRRGDFEDWIAAGLGCATSDLCVVPVHEGGTLPEDPSEAAGVVVTGSPAMVSECEPWSVRAGAWLAAATLAEVPVLGICYGHQLLAQALGGRVGANPRGRSIGTVTVEFSTADNTAAKNTRFAMAFLLFGRLTCHLGRGQAHFTPKTPQNEPVPDGFRAEPHRGTLCIV